MDKKYCRYSEKALKNLGVPVHSMNFNKVDKDDSRYIDMAIGNFKNIIDIIYSSSDGSLDNDISKLNSMNLPPEVKQFISSILSNETPAFPAAGTSDVAFDSIIPRSVQTTSELQPYIRRVQNYISERREQLKFEQSQSRSE